MLIVLVNILFLIKTMNCGLTSNSTNDRIEEFQQYRAKRQDGYEFVDCVLPPYPENGNWTVISGKGKPGQTIFPNTLIKFSCDEGYSLKPSVPYFLCDADWNPGEMPQCQDSSCPILKSTSTRIIKCLDRSGNSIPCSNNRVKTATAECREFYELAGERNTIQCRNNEWSDTLSNCKAICGKPSTVGTRRLRSIIYERGILKFPWAVMIFNKKDEGYRYICTGTLISPSHVLTAAHCVTDQNGKTHPIKNYRIAAGKAFHSYGDSRDAMAQYVDVADIIAHPQFDTETFRADIALLKTRRPLRLTSVLQPVCFYGVDQIEVPNGTTGVITLWALEQNREITDEAQYLQVTKDEKNCNQRLPPEFDSKYKLADKLCAIIENDKICTGFSGSGWTFENPLDNRYYLHGIVDIGVYNKTTECAESSTLCISVPFYYDFIKTNMETN